MKTPSAIPIAFLTAVSVLSACQSQTENEKAGATPLDSATSNPAFPYNLAEPDTVLQLPSELDEISGLYWADDERLFAIADEQGEVFVISSASGEILSRHKFDGEGDFEGVCGKGDQLFALRSDGKVFRLSGLEPEGFQEVQDVDTGLDFDCEGIVYQSGTNRFLIACKESEEDSFRAIYSTSLEKGAEAELAYRIDIRHLEDSLITTSFDKVAYAVANALSSNDHAGLLGPSGLAIHPKEQKIYILSGTSSLLIVLDANGEFETAIPLPIDILPQPEGITFSPKGELFIASEKANSAYARLVKYEVQ